MSTCPLPDGYKPILNLRQTEEAICRVKDRFQEHLARAMNLSRVSAPLFVLADSGINDNLNGIERPAGFAVKAMGDARAEIVQSLAKWKRMALADYGFGPDEGLYTDMNAIRPDEDLSPMHSIYVDQWDWERVMRPEQRTRGFLEEIVRTIYGVIVATERHIAGLYDHIEPTLPETIAFVHTTELAARYPGEDRLGRENLAAREHGAVFIMGIGAPMADGQPHDGRAPDYDDWITQTDRGPGLNGDIVVWNPVLGRSFELSSMGIRVSPESLARQLEIRGCTERAKLPFHRRLLAGELPQTIGGGIGQSRLCMFFLRKAHVGEVQSSLWPADVRARCAAANITLL